MRCDVCQLECPGACPNYWCARPDRGFDLVWAIGPFEGRLRHAIRDLKYHGGGWRARELGVLLARFLIEHGPWFDDVDLIVGAPAAPGGPDHVGRILEAAGPAIAGLWRVDTEVIEKTAATRRLAAAPSAETRRLWAASEARAALRVVKPVDAARVLVFDDVLTDGSTLREVSGALKAAGAQHVEGLALARVTVLG